ncbi:hypothetical protein LY76DRAFT_588273 [Colletotrichum caudatum]|nr:hypothetical protein LY76DRAFT_588273 [Colletotrichum caudatum]
MIVSRFVGQHFLPLPPLVHSEPCRRRPQPHTCKSKFTFLGVLSKYRHQAVAKTGACHLWICWDLCNGSLAQAYFASPMIAPSSSQRPDPWDMGTVGIRL